MPRSTSATPARPALATLESGPRRRPARADIAFIDTLFDDPDWIHALFGPDRGAVYPEADAWLTRMDTLRVECETRIAVPSLDLATVARQVSFPYGPVADIVVAAVHLDLSHAAHDCWTARADELEKLLEIHRLMHLVASQDHHHENDRQPASVLELPAPSRPTPRRPARVRKVRPASRSARGSAGKAS